MNARDAACKGVQLVILAAGIGRRFGGLKQLAPVGPSGEAIMDYTVYDALRSGFDRVVLVVRAEIEDAVREHVALGFGRHVDVEFADQRLDALPDGIEVPSRRTRPWGTGQAVLVARPFLRGPFAVANADDLYGTEAIAAIGGFLARAQTTSRTWAVVGFPVGETLPDRGAVSRAFTTATAGWLKSIDEVLDVRRHPDGACLDVDGEIRIVPKETPVSMNLWAFTPDLLPDLEIRFRRFMAVRPGAEREFLLPVVIGEAVGEDVARVRVLPTTSRWCGMTSAKDLEAVRKELARRVAAGIYPERLWG